MKVKTHPHSDYNKYFSPEILAYASVFVYPFSTSCLLLLLHQICSLSSFLSGHISSWYIQWLPDSKSWYISISYCLLCGLFKGFTSWLFVGPFETDESRQSEFQSRRNCIILSRSHFHGNCFNICFQLELETLVLEMWPRAGLLDQNRYASVCFSLFCV